MVYLDMSKYSIVTLEEVPSTNCYAIDNIKFFEEGTVIYTSHQTAGRGRFNRRWMSDDSDNIYMSLVLKPKNIDNYPFPNLTQYLSVCVCKLLEHEFNLTPQIKWPNDILVNNSKISGILAETSVYNNKINGVVLGLGLNVNMGSDLINKIDQKATSIFILTKKHYNSNILLTKLLDIFFENYDNFVKCGFSLIKNDYINRCQFIGKNILISENGIKSEYFAKSINDEGLLIAIDKNNNECKIITGDILC